MIGNTGTIMSIRLLRSKLRKREESSGVPQPITVEITTQPSTALDMRKRSNASNAHHQYDSRIDAKNVETTMDCIAVSKPEREVTFIRTSGGLQANNWEFPPKAPAPQIYNCTNDSLIATNDKNGFKGLRKQFSGRFKRLVSKKPEPSPAIPPELKSQLKTIYVY